MTRPLKGWWIVIFNTLAASPFLVDAILATLSQAEVQALIPPHLVPYYVPVMAIITIWLRSITDTPIGKAVTNAPDQ